MAARGSRKTARQTYTKPRKKRVNSSKKNADKLKHEAVEENFLASEILIIFVFLVSILLFIGNLGLGGAVGNLFKGFQLGLFGVAGYLFPAVFLVSTAFLISNKGSLASNIKVAACIGAILCAAGIMHSLFGKPFDNTKSLLAIYNERKAGGLAGGLLYTYLNRFAGKVGAVIILLALLIICVICISERSFVGFVKKKGKNAYTQVIDDFEKRKRKKHHTEYNEQYDEEPEDEPEYEQQEAVNNKDYNKWRRTVPYTESEININNLPPLRRSNKIFNFIIEPAKKLLNQSPKETLQEAPKEALKEPLKENALNEADDVRADFMLNSDANPPNPHLHKPKASAAQNRVDFKAFQSRLKAVKPEVFTGTIIRAENHGTIETKEEDCLDTETIRRANEILSRKEILKANLKTEAAEQKFYGEFKAEEEFEEIFLESALENDADIDEEALKEAKEQACKEACENESSYEELYSINLPEKTCPAPEKSNKKRYALPPLSLLKKGSNPVQPDDEEYKKIAIKLQQTLHNFGVEVSVGNISCGPTVTRYELQPEQGVKVSRIVALADDIKLNLAARDIRIEAPIPGKAAVGIEVPNKENTIVYLRELLESEEFKSSRSKLSFALGRDIGGQPVVADISKMPHLLIAGATGSGKSVCINTLIMSLIFKYSPEEVRMIMIDPKVVELSIYNGIPHLLIPVVTEPKKAAAALSWAVAEMTQRYKKFAEAAVRDLKGYNEKMAEQLPENEFEALPQIVIIIDELADLMMVVHNEVEDCICRLAQLARACGIHLVIATQRPSVNVITGLIKANIPSRIAFAVSSGIDSRTILDSVGAEKLLGKGDMLLDLQSSPKPVRIQGAFVSDREVSAVVEFLTSQLDKIEYDEMVAAGIEEAGAGHNFSAASERDELFAEIGRCVIKQDSATIGYIQRLFKLGFNRAARIMDQLEAAKVVETQQGTKKRSVIMTLEDFEKIL